VNPTVGDLDGNLGKILSFAKRAAELKADLVVFPELVICGYPPEDLLLKPQFISDNLSAVEKIAKKISDPGLIVGFVSSDKGKLYNSAVFIFNGRVRALCNKALLPNYGVFDEKRYFAEGKPCPVFEFKGVKIGLSICEDIWHKGGPVAKQLKSKADIIVNINASPYHVGKIGERLKVLKERLKEGKANIVYVNMVGGQDELVFDGGSFVLDKKGGVLAMGKQFEEDLIFVDITGKGKKNRGLIDLKPPIRTVKAVPLSAEEEVYKAVTFAVSDYVKKNGFKKVVIGLSGGIDSGITATIARDALGKDNVNCVFMPSIYTSERSKDDAYALAKKLGVNLIDISITGTLDAYNFALSSEFKGLNKDITEENLQARIRGNLLMALSNKFNWLVLTTGNKSEMSVGYATLYGDMAGGFAVLKDIPKTLVYKLANWRNRAGEVIPKSMIEREPTAELKPDQKDRDVLPPYEILDPIVDLYVKENLSYKQIVKKGFSAETVKKVIRMIDRSEYKRRQSSPGPKITHRAFGKDWRLPITNLYKG